MRLNSGSVSAVRIIPGEIAFARIAPYSASKAAVIALTANADLG